MKSKQEKLPGRNLNASREAGLGTVTVNHKASPIHLKALALMRMYGRATGALISIHDHNFMPIPEQFEEMLCQKNICLFCLKYREHIEVKNIAGLMANPCRDMHINALRESHRYGGSYIYGCSLGFMFWTSPLFHNKQFSGAIMGSGICGAPKEEICSRMYQMCGKAESKTAIRKLLSQFPQGVPQKIKAHAELTLLCAQSLSAGSGGKYETMKRRSKQQMVLSAKIIELKKQYPPGSARPAYPLDKERKLLKAFHRGDTELGLKTLNEILASLFFSYPDQLSNIQYRAMELAVLLSRIDTGPGLITRAAIETKNNHIKLIREAGAIEDLFDIMNRIAEQLSDKIIGFREINHASALKKAERYILDNFTRKISLEEIAGDSGFSAPYFSTIFKEEMGENLSSYLNRLRVLKAGFMLTDSNYSLSKIARACGFEDQSWFSKIFKSYTGISPGKYRSQGGKQNNGIPSIGFSGDYLKLLKEKQ